ncbi:type II toxin-antitoxin system VapB family antitoxin [Sphingomonas phyllosphaerae]|uniref:type II toxin-antitoxin system VapB family antitoxin n=1 Tax=Sphingomonas phyllosphaerae TaxID=257003 RepID=UPI0003B707B4|nr:type II toxin-antitoxin system VapB family antitoxin [Sphingomonas phyllosphaerae]
MASLYIKDPEANRLAERLAAARGLTKTAAVKLALAHELERNERVVPLRDRLAAWRSAHPLGEPSGLTVDKAFYDALNDEDED